MARVTTSRPSDDESVTAPRHELRALARFLIDSYLADGKPILAKLSAIRADDLAASDALTPALDHEDDDRDDDDRDDDDHDDRDDDRLAAQAEALEGIGCGRAYAERAVRFNYREQRRETQL